MRGWRGRLPNERATGRAAREMNNAPPPRVKRTCLGIDRGRESFVGELWARVVAGFWNNAINYCVYLAIFALFLLSFIKCVLPVWRTRSLLRRAIRYLRKGEKSKRSWQEDTFLGKGALYPHWSEYLDNLFFADGEYHNASNVEDYINEETVISQPGRASLAAAAPGVMVSLGFLGTLLGITQGLAGFSMEDSEAVMTAIRTLIPGMKFAFTTSIVGVVASILFTVFTGIVNGSAKSTLSAFYAAMHNNAGVLTVDPLNQIAIYQQEQTAQVQAIASELSGRVAERIGQALETSVSPIRESLDSFCAHTTRQQTQALEYVVNSFVDRMDEVLQGRLRDLAACIDETVRWQKSTRADMGEIAGGMQRAAVNVQQIEKTAEDLLAKVDVYFVRLNAMQGKTEQAYASVAGNVEQMEIVARQQATVLQALSKLQGDIGAAGTEQARGMAETLRGIQTDLERTAQAMRDSGRTLAQSHEAFVTGVNADLEKTYNAIFSDMGETTKKLEWMVEDVKAAMERLPQVVDETGGVYAEQNVRLTEALRRTQEALEAVADRIGRAH